jgi:hypothetical protein
MNGIELIAAERQRQIDKKGWSAKHDAEHIDNSLSLAAICYAAPEPVFLKDDHPSGINFHDVWPESWHENHDKRPRKNGKLISPTKEQRLRMLAKAGALIAAEIDRLQAEN